MPEAFQAFVGCCRLLRATIGSALRMRKNPHAVALGRRGGKKGGPKGGKARMAGLTDAQRRELARKAAGSRWKKAKKKP